MTWVDVNCPFLYALNNIDFTSSAILGLFNTATTSSVFPSRSSIGKSNGTNSPLNKPRSPKCVSKIICLSDSLKFMASREYKYLASAHKSKNAFEP